MRSLADGFADPLGFGVAKWGSCSRIRAGTLRNHRPTTGTENAGYRRAEQKGWQGPSTGASSEIEEIAETCAG